MDFVTTEAYLYDTVFVDFSKAGTKNILLFMLTWCNTIIFNVK